MKNMYIKYRLIRNLLLINLIFIFLSCSKGDNPTNSSGTTGPANLIVNINSTAVTPKVKVTGNDTTVYYLSATDTLKSVTPGTFVITAYRVDQNPAGNDLIGKSFGDLNPVRKINIKAGETKSINIDYVEFPGSGMCWVSDDNGSRLLAFDKNSITSPGAPAPAVKIQFSFEGPRGIAFDKMGDLWVAGFSKNRIFAFSPEQLSGNTTASPAVTLTNNSISGPIGLIFDIKGDLWISNWTTGLLVAYKPSTLINMLSSPGSVSNSPDIQITSANLTEPEYMAFDALGNLWVAGKDPSTNNADILKFSAINLGSSGNISPSITITESSTPTLINVTALAFDKNGNLWGTDGNSFFRFSASQLKSSGATVPQFYRSVPAPSLLIGLAFDAQANLWMGETYTPRLIRYTYPNSGYGTTYNTSSDLDEPTWIVFFPPPPGYLIYY